jgi:hypothetical protein
LDNKYKFHLVNCNNVCTLLNLGGLGIRCLLTFNQAMLGKWLYGSILWREAFWQQVMDKKYGSLASGRCSKVVIKPNGVSLWKHIRKG